MAGRVGADPREFAPQLGRRVDAGKTVTQVQRNQCGMSDFIKTTFCLALAGFPEAFASSFSGIEQEPGQGTGRGSALLSAPTQALTQTLQLRGPSEAAARSASLTLSTFCTFFVKLEGSQASARTRWKRTFLGKRFMCHFSGCGNAGTHRPSIAWCWGCVASLGTESGAGGPDCPALLPPSPQPGFHHSSTWFPPNLPAARACSSLEPQIRWGKSSHLLISVTCRTRPSSGIFPC